MNAFILASSALEAVACALLPNSAAAMAIGIRILGYFINIGVKKMYYSGYFECLRT